MNKVWIYIKLFYLYLVYWCVGLTQEDFYISKGNYLADLENYHSAIKFYKKALKEEEIFRVYAMIGWCYCTLEEDDKALKYYRKSYEKIKSQSVSVTLAFLEMKNGSLEQCYEVFQNIKEQKIDLPQESFDLYTKVSEYLKKSNILVRTS